MSEFIKILTTKEINRKINRMAYQILENYYDEDELFLVGVYNQGYYIAERLSKVIKKKSKVKISLCGLHINKKDPLKEPLELDIDPKKLHKKSIILVDDVANTGRTLTFALKPLLNTLPKRIQVAVLVDRKHKTFPVGADFVGLSLATTIQEHIHVEMGKDQEESVYLS